MEETTATANPEEACPQAAAADDDVLRAWFQLYAGMQNVTAAMLAEVERHAGLAAAEFQVLWHLHRVPEHRAPMNEVSRLLNFSTAGTTKLVDRLAAMGLVERHTCRSDRRVILAELTGAGDDAAIRAARILADALRERFLGRIGEERMSGLLEVFGMLAEESGAC
ncbi:MAG TPA: MarR family winged helix-turn-helix transcriptional regulator [Actinospica sp.]|nr:MarR family winged helix-turn-helix transcriptional regulator [Actinospica sp.]